MTRNSYVYSIKTNFALIYREINFFLTNVADDFFRERILKRKTKCGEAKQGMYVHIKNAICFTVVLEKET